MPQSHPAPMAARARALQGALLDLMFPPRCVVCRRRGSWFCADCCAQINRIPVPWCEHCGRPLRSGECAYCHAWPLQIDGLRAVAFFDGPLRTAIHRFKYNHRPELATPLSRLLCEFLREHPLPVDVIVPVPLHPDRERQRGYNQARLLAAELAVYAGRPMWYNGVERIRATAPQVELNAPCRRANVRDAFGATPAVAGRRILLIDDVCTTGATMEACSLALHTRGAESVWGLVLARGR